MLTTVYKINSAYLCSIKIMKWATVLGLALSIIVVWGDNDNWGSGEWFFQNVVQCSNPAQYPIHVEMTRRKLSRTRDGYSIITTLPHDITNTSHGVHVEVCTKVDGGCRVQFVLDDDSFCNFCKRMLDENFVNILALAGLKNPDCPIPKGIILIKDYEMDYDGLPEKGMYGFFIITGWLEEMIYGVKSRIACVSVEAEFRKTEEDDE